MTRPVLVALLLGALVLGTAFPHLLQVGAVALDWRTVLLGVSATAALGGLLLFALGVGLISLLLMLNQQLADKFDKNLADIDLVIGAKGSPLQMILCKPLTV